MSTRRHFLKMVGSTAVVGLIQLRCSAQSGPGATGPVSAGNVSSVPVGYLAFVPGEPVILGRDAGGLYAMTAICPHQNCDMASQGSISSTSVVCLCHGSRFGADGAVQQGPAAAALEHYQVDLATDGTITVQAGTTVSAATRTPVP